MQRLNNTRRYTALPADCQNLSQLRAKIIRNAYQHRVNVQFPHSNMPRERLDTILDIHLANKRVSVNNILDQLVEHFINFPPIIPSTYQYFPLQNYFPVSEENMAIMLNIKILNTQETPDAIRDALEIHNLTEDDYMRIIQASLVRISSVAPAA